MRLVIQRVSSATVSIQSVNHASIGKGLLILAGIEATDTSEDVEWLSAKVCSMRIFSDEEGKMNLDLNQASGNILLVSQFTLHASTKKGNRPSFIKAARPDQAIPLYEKLKAELEKQSGSRIQSGVFGADMQIALVNDGPVTILIDSKTRE